MTILSKTDQRVEDVLALSFEELPSYLRSCFLYLSMFPENYEIPTDILIQLWIAEGFVLSKLDGEGFVEDVAESYLIELVERFMVQVGKRDEATLKIKTCRMHDLMRDLCLPKAKQENFLHIVERDSPYSNYSSRTVRRIVANRYPQVGIKHCNNLRTILFFDDQLFEDRDKCSNCFMIKRVFRLQGSSSWDWELMFNNSKLIRVLDFEEGWYPLKSYKLLRGICNLIHLRFLSFRGLCFEDDRIELPSSLGKLTCLQTLDLRVRYCNCFYVPNVLWRLEQLKHLYLPQFFSLCMILKGFFLNHKLALHTLSKLQTLVNFDTSICRGTDLSILTSLRMLNMSIEWISIEKDFKKDSNGNPALFLSSCPNLCKLHLHKGKIAKVPEYCDFPSTIAEMILEECGLEEDPMPTLEKLPNLRILNIKSNGSIGNEMVCSPRGFPKLHSLTLDQLEYLEEWKVDEGAMPVLCHLCIRKCLNLKKLPDGLRFITILQELKIIYMPKEFKDKVEEGFQHLPSLIFQNITYEHPQPQKEETTFTDNNSDQNDIVSIIND